MGFFKQFLSANLLGKNCLSLTWAEINILKALMPEKKHFTKTKNAAVPQTENNIWTPKNHSHLTPPPLS